MNKKAFFYCIFLLAFIPFNTNAQISKADIDKAIDISSLKHPYLYFTEEEKPALIKRINTDPESNNIFRKLEAEAKMWLAMPVDNTIPVQGKNTRAGWTEFDTDGKYAKFYKTNRNNAFHLAFLYQMTGEQKYATKDFHWLDFFDMELKTAKEKTIMATAILPIESFQEANEIPG